MRSVNLLYDIQTELDVDVLVKIEEQARVIREAMESVSQRYQDMDKSSLTASVTMYGERIDGLGGLELRGIAFGVTLSAENDKFYWRLGALIEQGVIPDFVAIYDGKEEEVGQSLEVVERVLKRLSTSLNPFEEAEQYRVYPTIDCKTGEYHLIQNYSSQNDEELEVIRRGLSDMELMLIPPRE